MNRIEKITYVFISVFVFIGVVLSHVAPEYYKQTYVVEDGLIQWLQVIALVIVMSLCFWRVYVLGSRKPLLFLVMTFLLGLLFFFAAGEEISWGQRIFGIASPEWFATHNNQEEINVHNLVVSGTKLNRVVFSTGLGILMFFYLLVVSPLYRKQDKLARIVDDLAVPIPKLHHTIGFIAVVVIAQLLVSSSKRGEIVEFGSLFIFFLIIAFPFNDAIFCSDDESHASPSCK